MPDKKLTDAEIVKALEYCSKQGLTSECEGCKMGNGECRDSLVKCALDSINRLQAENERLKSLMPEKRCDNCIHEEKSLQASPCCECFNYRNFAPKNFLKLIKAEAYKEFAEKAEKEILPQLTTSTLEKKEAYYFCLGVVSNILNEMESDNCGV